MPHHQLLPPAPLRTSPLWVSSGMTLPKHRMLSAAKLPLRKNRATAGSSISTKSLGPCGEGSGANRSVEGNCSL